MNRLFTLRREPTQHVSNGQSFTPGVLYLDNVRFCVTCEDEDRHLESTGAAAKVFGETAIPVGKYRVTNSFSNHFGRTLPEVRNVPFFSGIRMHGGNHAEDSEGCILVGKVRIATGIAQCADTVARIMDVVDKTEDVGGEVWLEIIPC